MGFRLPQLGLLSCVGLRPTKGTPSDYMLSTGTIGLHENLSPGLCAGLWKFCSLLLWLRPCWNFPETFMTAESKTQTFMGLPLTVWRSVVYNWRYDTFYMLQKNEVLIVWPGATHALIGACQCQSEPTSEFSATDPCQFHPNRTRFGRMAPQKNLFSAYNRGQPCLWMAHGH